MPHEPGSPYPAAPPPPLLPKPAKDNLRLQRLLKKAAKKKVSCVSLRSGSFRASLSPVSEASHDQDAAPQPRPETTKAPPALPDPPRTLVPASRSPYKPVIQHVASPLQKKPFFKLSEQRSLAEHFRATAPPVRAPGPDAPKPPGSSAPVVAPREVTHVSRVHIHVQPAPSPRSPAPAANLAAGSGGHGDPHRAEYEAGVAAPKPAVTRQPIPVALIQPLTPNTQATSPCPAPPSATRLSPSVEAAAPRQLITKIVVPIAPIHRSPGPARRSPLPRNPSAPTEPPPVPPKPSRFAAASDTRQLSGPSRAFTPEPPGAPVSLVSSGLSRAPAGEAPKATPTPTPRTRPSGWTRLKKQLIVEPGVPAFPETEDAPGQPGGQPEGQQPGGQPGQASEGPEEPAAGPSAPRPLVSRATKMWDAVLYRMSVAKSGDRPEGAKEGARAPPGGRFLPFLYRPRFDARKLCEVAAQSPGQVHSVPGVSLRPSVAPKNFNRTAACWRLK
ncbi:proline-rich protein 33-like [Gracilinanus agilis]|uniref:proline-rich protein 33-like n=1 Tax=Gracilinanus agilis TaxID=191870 RepID=UPI001CFCE87C|nr:proline-rich protein 33-like [Gracilinanus agilis]